MDQGGATHSGTVPTIRNGARENLRKQGASRNGEQVQGGRLSSDFARPLDNQLESLESRGLSSDVARPTGGRNVERKDFGFGGGGGCSPRKFQQRPHTKDAFKSF